MSHLEHWSSDLHSSSGTLLTSSVPVLHKVCMFITANLVIYYIMLSIIEICTHSSKKKRKHIIKIYKRPLSFPFLIVTKPGNLILCMR